MIFSFSLIYTIPDLQSSCEKIYQFSGILWYNPFFSTLIMSKIFIIIYNEWRLFYVRASDIVSSLSFGLAKAYILRVLHNI
jgi:hypothetical protein